MKIIYESVVDYIPNEEELVETFVSILNDYVEEFREKVTSKCKVKGRGIIGRSSTGYSSNSFYIDYFCLYPTYSKETAKLALDIFKKYSNKLISYLDKLKSENEDIEYFIDKTEVSSSRIGKSLYADNLPFKLPNKLYIESE